MADMITKQQSDILSKTDEEEDVWPPKSADWLLISGQNILCNEYTLHSYNFSHYLVISYTGNTH